MRRRKFIMSVGAAATIGLAGCTGSQAPPPRKSNVVEKIKATDGALKIDTEDKTWVMSRTEVSDDSQNSLGNALGALSPVGVASAKGKGGAGRGVTGRAAGGYSKAPKTHHGRAWLYGGDYTDDWYDEHKDEVKKYPVKIVKMGVAFLGPAEEFKDDKPGPGPVPWDETYDNPDDVEKYEVQQPGWYRVGAKVVGEESGHDFRWEAVDFKLGKDGNGGYEVKKQWKVSPRI